MSTVFSYRIQAGFGVTENFGLSKLTLSWKGHLERFGKTGRGEAWSGGWLPGGSFQQMRKPVSWCVGDLEGNT